MYYSEKQLRPEIEKGSVLQANINIKGGLDHLIQNPKKAKISSITMSCSGIVIYLKNKPQIKIERISYHYGGDLRIDRAEILNEVVNGLKMIELLIFKETRMTSLTLKSQRLIMKHLLK